MLQARNLAYRYPGGETLTFPDLSCAEGETQLLLGQSGSGKTTMLQLLAGLRRPTAGEVTVNGQRLADLGEAALDTFRGKHIGMVFQTPHFVRALTVRENLRLAQNLAGAKTDDVRIDDLLAELDLTAKADSLPGRLSVGQQQRAAIARALVNRPAVLFADEPTSALDDENTRRVVDLLRRQATAANAALLIVTHDNRLTSVIERQTRLASPAAPESAPERQ